MKEKDYIDIDNFNADYAKHVYRLTASSHSIAYADSTVRDAITSKKYSIPPEVMEFLNVPSIYKPYACRLSIKLRAPIFVDLYFATTLGHLLEDAGFEFLDWVLFMMETGYVTTGLYYVNCNTGSPKYGNIAVLSYMYPRAEPKCRSFANITELIQCITCWLNIVYENFHTEETIKPAMQFLDSRYDYIGTFPSDYTIRQVLTSVPQNEAQKESIEYNERMLLKLMHPEFVRWRVNMPTNSGISLAYFIVHGKA